MTLLERLTSDGPKRILALDGGGIRGALALGYLSRLEYMLRKRYDKPDMCLSDYYDLIGGTSTGSIIAAGLSIGMEVEEIRELYYKLGPKVFSKRQKVTNLFKIGKALKASFSYEPMEEYLDKVFGNIRLGDNNIKTGLCIVVKRADTQSVWPLINHPDGAFYNSKWGQNRTILLKDAIRASSAAPTYFKPKVIPIGGGVDPDNPYKGAFVDGGVSMANNPALQLLMVATLEGFPFKWKKGENDLMVTSVGTGNGQMKDATRNIAKRWLLDWAKDIPGMLMMDASIQNELMLQWISNSPTARDIDMEIGDLKNDLLTKEPVLTYQRYNVTLEKDALGELGFDLSKKSTESLKKMDKPSNIPTLYQIGAKAATSQIKGFHFPAAFDLHKVASKRASVDAHGTLTDFKDHK